jgi:ABC-2 type transport system ATP-binding protein
MEKVMENNDLPDPIIELKGLTLEFEPGVGVLDLSYYVPRGSIFGLIGPSGCGKTTTVRLMLGIYKPDSGEAIVLGQRSDEFSQETREQMGYMPQQFVLYPDLTVKENLRFAASLYGMSWFGRGDRFDELLEIVELADAADRLARNLSGGMRRRLELAASLLHEPRILFADEPTAGIDPALRSKVWHYLERYRDKGNTLFITTQYVSEAAYCDLVAVMRDGRLLRVDTPKELRRFALGGEVIALTVDEDRELEAVEFLEKQPRVQKTSRIDDAAGLIHVYVDEADEMLPVLIGLLNRETDIDIQRADKYEPPFDDIFRLLMQKAEVSA